MLMPLSGHAPVNGINMYYEVHGPKEGVPLVLLHGGGSTIQVTFSKVLPVFAGRRRVIALEEHYYDAEVAAACLRHLRTRFELQRHHLGEVTRATGLPVLVLPFLPDGVTGPEALRPLVAPLLADPVASAA